MISASSTDLLIVAAVLAATMVSSARWLRVSQREHYLGGSVTRFALRWWNVDWLDRGLLLIALAGAVGAFWFSPAALATTAVVAAAPIGLGLKGRTSKLAWTRRLKTVAAVAGLATVVDLLVISVLLPEGKLPAVAAAIAVGAPLIFDAVLYVLAPVERRVARRFVVAAQARLEQIDPVRVAITGSYGKTTIKGYVRHLIGNSRSTLATPASFNNTAGLSRAINESLSLETEVFIAEMGTYGPGEIAKMCSWIRPSISVLASIGPVHLERFGDLDTIVSSKAEIFGTSRTAILNIDAHGLAHEAVRLAASGIRVIRCSALDPEADVYCCNDAGRLTVTNLGEVVIAGMELDAAPTNVACSVAVASALGIDNATIAERLPTVPTADHRRQVVVSPSGITVIDDTYNSNPAGAAAAVETLERLNANRKVVVTPGMVELGARQRPENERFAEKAARIADDLIIVSRINRDALEFGARDQRATVHHVATREDAVEWVRAHLQAGDAVLYENDLPDHFP
ncbi:MAG: UDP-N-acetylmuramoyl-tripeptide--D-alanyl-D-alanine ligase [Candidatus Poriferisodalaceae bacterium]|jgi:UDP-N-acetylmuramoyl-tripeptide--D-alanyl-D-alanine ligase